MSKPTYTAITELTSTDAVSADVTNVPLDQLATMIDDIISYLSDSTTLADYGITDTLVNTFNGRSGAVSPTSDDYSASLINYTDGSTVQSLEPAEVGAQKFAGKTLDTLKDSANYARVSTSAGGINLVDNGDFEVWDSVNNAFPNWNTDANSVTAVEAGATVTQDTSPNSGNYCAKITTDGVHQFTGIQCTRYFSVQEGQSYVVSLAAKSDGTHQIQVTIWYGTLSGNGGPSAILTTSSDSWQTATATITIPSDAITMYVAAKDDSGTTDQYSFWVDSISIEAPATSPWTVATSATTLTGNSNVIAGTSSGAFTITLPASPSAGTTVRIADGDGVFGTNNLTIDGNSENIMGSSDTLILDVNYSSAYLIYYNSTRGWILFQP